MRKDCEVLEPTTTRLPEQPKVSSLGASSLLLIDEDDQSRAQ